MTHSQDLDTWAVRTTVPAHSRAILHLTHLKIAHVAALQISNLSPHPQSVLELAQTPGMLPAGDKQNPIPPGAHLILLHRTATWPVTPQTRIVLRNPGPLPIPYAIGILGRPAGSPAADKQSTTAAAAKNLSNGH